LPERRGKKEEKGRKRKRTGALLSFRGGLCTSILASVIPGRGGRGGGGKSARPASHVFQLAFDLVQEAPIRAVGERGEKGIAGESIERAIEFLASCIPASAVEQEEKRERKKKSLLGCAAHMSAGRKERKEGGRREGSPPAFNQ